MRTQFKNILTTSPKILANAWETARYVPTIRYVKEQCFLSAWRGTNDELVPEWKHDMTSTGEGRKNEIIKAKFE
jgi:hypothetical protein